MAAVFLILAALGTGPILRAADARVRLTSQHVDFLVVYAPGSTNELSVVVRDEDSLTNYLASQVVLEVRPSAETTIPDGFPEFGDPGSPFWILPASQDAGLLYLGVSGEGLPRGTFAAPPEVQLVGVQSAGSFFAWQFDGTGNLDLFMDSRDGIGPADRIPAPVGGHSHFNWGFSSNGWSEVTFRVEGRLAGATTNLSSANASFQFAVEPLPESVPATIAVVEVTSEALVCSLAGTPGAPYRILQSADLLNWSEVAGVIGDDDPVPFSTSLTSSAGGGLYLRAVAASW